MVIQPTNAEMIFYIVFAILGLIGFIAVHLPWNDHYDPNANDPYRYCPKED